MAIIGSFNDMPLPDVLSLVGRTSGRFFITDLPVYIDYELQFFDGALIALIVNNVPVKEVWDVRHTMVELMRTRIGQFRYERRQPQDLLEYFRLPVDQVLLSSLAAADEIDAMRPFLPNEKTVFIQIQSTEKWMDDDLSYFYMVSSTLLKEGASGEVIAERTGQYLDQVLFSLYKLRAAGLIKPSRWASRPAVHAAVASAVSPDSASADLRSVSIQRPKAGFLSRLMSRLGSALSGVRA